MLFDHINEVSLSENRTLKGDSGTYTCDALIIMTGASARYLGLPTEQQFMGQVFLPAPLAMAFSIATRK